jgi:acetamidase/formamidase
MAVHRLDPSPETTTDVFSRALAPVLRVEPGDTLVVRSLDASGYLEPQRSPGGSPPRMHPAGRGHCLTGPIDVVGAEPGAVLAVHLRTLLPDPWGWTVAGGRPSALTTRLGLDAGAPAWLLWDLDVERGTGTDQHGRSVGLAPFLGVVGLPPAEAGEHSTIPPRPEGGGNIDCKDLVAGSILYLPVTVPGALLCVGDGHGAQGHGEVGGTAIECAMTTELVVDLVDERPAPGVHAEAPAGRITFGFDADLNEATAVALDAMLAWLAVEFGTDRREALALASATVDLHVTQVANQVWGVHAVLPAGAIR